jgi:GT2 family glycosyltransferase
MNRFWHTIIRPIIEKLKVNYIVEIGSDTGVNTRNILDYCLDNDAHMTAIDPQPKFDVNEFKSEYGDKFEIYKELSLSRLPLLKNYDVILIDGDHNWYTVYNELKIIEKNFKTKKFPIIFLHDLGWPYDRRDVYYNPQNIPDDYRQPYKKLGLHPQLAHLKENGGLNLSLNNSVYVNNPRNGVLTAVEDFIDKSTSEFSFDLINAFFGLGILYPKNDEIENIVKKVIRSANLLGILEEERVRLYIEYSESVSKTKLLEKRLYQTEFELKSSNELISEKNLVIQELMGNEKQINELNSQIDNLSTRIYEMDYLNNKDRSITQKLISKFPTLYIILSRKNKGIKTALTNVKGYRAIKKNHLFDIGYYLKYSDDVRLSGADPFIHYLYHGYKEGRNPSSTFDGNYYLNNSNDVKNSNLNPLVHYSLYGMKEGRKPNEIFQGYKRDLPSKSNLIYHPLSNHQINSILAAFNFNKKISIIIPIYNAYEDVKDCINSILKNTKLPYELILIDDSSSDKRIGTLLDELENLPHIKVIKNKENKGFVKNINMGIHNSDGDVVLLNSDTVVTPRWLQKLTVAAYSDRSIGTVTPLSNAAGAFSVPEIGKENEIPIFLSRDGMASLVETVSDNVNMEVPTGNGFCLFIKRSIINDVGFFDETAFGRGYGEENDFCMRAIDRSWKNIIDDSTYIYHKRSASFSDKKKELIKQHRAILDKKYPSYTKKVHEFTSSVKLKNIQDNIRSEMDDINFDRINYINKKRILYVLHQGEGGTFKTNKDLMQNIRKTFECFILTSTTKQLLLWKQTKNGLEKINSWNIKSKWSSKKFYNNEFRDVYFNVLIGLKIDIVHIRHLFKHTFDLPDIAHKLGIPIILSFHDFYFICPSFHLIDENNKYCAGKCTEGKNQCKIPSELLNDLPVLKTFIDEWRSEISNIFDKCSTFITTSEVAKQIYISIYPQLAEKTFKVIEHGRDLNKELNSKFEFPSTDKPVKILIPGNIDNHKGAEFIKQLKKQDKRNRLEFHFMGSIVSYLSDYGIYHGKYERNSFCGMVNDIKPSFIGIFSIWPETYCHTLSEAWSCGIPVLTSKIGVLEERLCKNNGGWILNHNSPSESYKEIMRIVNSPEEYKLIKEQINKIHFTSTKEMAYEYEFIYWQNLLITEYSKIENIYRVAIIIKGRNGDHPPTANIRLLLPFYHPSLYGKIVPYIIDEDDLDTVNKDSFLIERIYDCVIVQRDVLDESFANLLVKRCKEHDIKLIYEIDDDLLNIDKTHPEYKKYLSKSTIIKYLIENADLVTVSTDLLKSKFEGIANNVICISNALDERLWCTKVNSFPIENDTIIVGYMGSFTHERDLIIIKNAIKNLQKKLAENNLKFNFEVIGGMRNTGWIKQIEIPSDNEEYRKFVQWLKKVTANWNIAVAPLADTNINRGKSEIKYLEYTGLDLAGVYSDIGSYNEIIKNGYNGLLVKNNNTKEWEEQIYKLITDSELCSNIKSNARNNLIEKYLLKHRTELWYKTVEELVDKKI